MASAPPLPPALPGGAAPTDVAPPNPVNAGFFALTPKQATNGGPEAPNPVMLAKNMAGEIDRILKTVLPKLLPDSAQELGQVAQLLQMVMARATVNSPESAASPEAAGTQFAGGGFNTP